MTLVLDTTILVDHLRLRAEGTAAFQDALQSNRRVAASILTRVELRRGARPHQGVAIGALDTVIDWVPVDHAIGAIASDHAERFGRSHASIDPVDYVVAATTERLDAELWTTNVRHFPMFPDLRPPY